MNLSAIVGDGKTVNSSDDVLYSHGEEEITYSSQSRAERDSLRATCGFRSDFEFVSSEVGNLGSLLVDTKCSVATLENLYESTEGTTHHFLDLKISIITVAFNMESTIADTCGSVDRQVYTNWEHLILDGASTDRTVEQSMKFSEERREIISKPDDGIYDAMNKGIELASGDVIGFLNADDLYDSSDVLTSVQDAFSTSNVDIVYGNLQYVDVQETTKVVRDWRACEYRRGMFGRGWMPPHPAVFVKKSVFETYGSFDRSFQICADWEWLFRVFEIQGVSTLHIPEYFVRMRMGGVSNRSLGNVLKSNREALRGFRQHNLPFPFLFFPGKLIHRGLQRLNALRKSRR